MLTPFEFGTIIQQPTHVFSHKEKYTISEILMASLPHSEGSTSSKTNVGLGNIYYAYICNSGCRTCYSKKKKVEIDAVVFGMGQKWQTGKLTNICSKNMVPFKK